MCISEQIRKKKGVFVDIALISNVKSDNLDY